MTDYQPVSCDVHSELELAVMHKQRLRMKWHDEAGNTYHDVVVPMDLETRDHQEYLVVRHGKNVESIRLDRIGSFEAVEE